MAKHNSGAPSILSAVRPSPTLDSLRAIAPMPPVQAPEPPDPEGRPAVPARFDDWGNVLTGLGMVGADKRLGGQFARQMLPQLEAEELWRGDDIIGRAVEVIPREMLREGHALHIEQDRALAEDIFHQGVEMEIETVLNDALEWARAFGGAGIVPVLDDGLDPTDPLDLTRVKEVKGFNAFTPRELQVAQYYSNPTEHGYGTPAFYRIVPFDVPISGPIGYLEGSSRNKRSIEPGPGTGTPIVEIHASRVFRLEGLRTTRGARLRNVNPGWGDSVLNRMLEVVRDFQSAWAGTGILMTDFSVSTLKIKGLAQLLANGETGGGVVAKRAQALAIARSIARVALVDSEEEFKRETTPLTGLAEALDKFMLRMAGTIEMPVGLLMGQAPAGLNATGDADIRWFYDQVKGKQRRVLSPALRWMYSLFLAAKQGPAHGKIPASWKVQQNPLWQLTELEQATARKTMAEADAVYITNNVVTPEEIARSRFGGDVYSFETVINTDLRDELLDDEEAQLAALATEPEPDPEDPHEGNEPAEAGPPTEQDPTDDKEASPAPPPAVPSPAKKDAVRADFIERRGNKWVVLSHEGKVLGTHPTRESAENQLRAVEAAKAREARGA
jgi:uncharacterized protein